VLEIRHNAKAMIPYEEQFIEDGYKGTIALARRIVDQCDRLLDATNDGIFTVKRYSHPDDQPLRFRVYRVH
jgi:hypothetical protein